MQDWKQLSKNDKEQKIEELTPRIVELKSRGQSWSFIKKSTGLPNNVLYDILKDNGMIQTYKTDTGGDNNHKEPLSSIPKTRSKQEAEMLKLHKEGLSYGRISKRFSMSKGGVYRIIQQSISAERKETRKNLKEQGKLLRKQVRPSIGTNIGFTGKDIEHMRALRAEGKDLREIGKIMGCSGPAVFYHLKKKPSKPVSQVAEVPSLSRRRLTREEKISIRQLAAEGYDSYKIGRKIGRPRNTVYFFMEKFGIKPGDPAKIEVYTSTISEEDFSFQTPAQMELARLKGAVNPKSMDNVGTVVIKPEALDMSKVVSSTNRKSISDYPIEKPHIGRPKAEVISAKEAGLEIVNISEVGLEPTSTEIALSIIETANVLTSLQAITRKFKDMKSIHDVRTRLYDERLGFDRDKFGIKTKGTKLFVYLKEE